MENSVIRDKAIMVFRGKLILIKLISIVSAGQQGAKITGLKIPLIKYLKKCHISFFTIEDKLGRLNYLLSSIRFNTRNTFLYLLSHSRLLIQYKQSSIWINHWKFVKLSVNNFRRIVILKNRTFIVHTRCL